MPTASATLKKHTPALQTALLTLAVFTIFILVYHLFYNIVMANYFLGGTSFIHGLNPYVETLKNGPSNQFKYSPFFALIFAGMDHFTSTPLLMPLLGAWIFLSVAVFSYGLIRWCNLFTKPALYMPVATVAALLDLMTSLQAYQANALIAGLTLIALADYRDEKYFRSGSLLMLATNLKVYPVIFLVALFSARPKANFALGALTVGLFVYLLPGFFVGGMHDFEMHLAWLRVVLHDGAGAVVLDLPAAFARAGLPLLGHVLYWVVIAVTLPTFFAYFPFSKSTDWRPWITQGLAALLLLSPRTEVYTFVLLAPAYIMMAQWCAESRAPKRRTWGGLTVTLLAVAIATCRYTDPQWYVSESPFEIVRIVGALGLWIFSSAIVVAGLPRFNVKAFTQRRFATTQ